MFWTVADVCTLLFGHLELIDGTQIPQVNHACRWTRGRLFDHAVATMLYEPCVANPPADVLKVRAPHTQPA